MLWRFHTREAARAAARSFRDDSWRKVSAVRAALPFALDGWVVEFHFPEQTCREPFGPLYLLRDGSIGYP